MQRYKLIRTVCLTVLCCAAVSGVAQTNVSSLVETNSSSPIEADVSDLAKTNVTPSVVLPVPRIGRAIFLVEHEKGSGSGFLMQEEGEVYFVSNIHVMEGGDNFSIRNIYGETVSVPDAVEVASDRDLVRFRVPSYKAALLTSADFGFGDKVCALGNSGGEGVITRLDGEILALGPDKVEVSAEFIPGNSGGPVLSESNQVIGVSTYLKRYGSMPDWIIEGTRFEGTRRMAVRVDNVDWISMTWDDFCREAARVQKIEDCSDAVIHIVHTLSEDGYEMIYSDVDHNELQKWLKRHNQDVRKAGGRMDKVETEKGDRITISYQMSSSMERAVRSNFASLGDVLKRLEKEASRTSRISLPFFKERMKSYQRYFNSSRTQMETVVETMF